MRTHAVAGDGMQFDPGASAAAGMITTAFGAAGLWLAQRMMGKAAFQNAINTGFSSLLDQLQEERATYQAAVTSLREELKVERAARHDEQIKTAAEIAQLRGDVMNLTQAKLSLEELLRRSGVEIPRPPPAPVAMVEIRKADPGAAI